MERPVMKAPVNDQGDFVKQLVNEGLVEAKCYGVIDLGSSEFEYNGEKKSVRKIQISFETQQMGTFKDKDTKEDIELPLTVHITKTFSLYEQSKLYPLIKDWVDIAEAKDNIFTLVGRSAELFISHSESKAGKKYADILKIKPSKKDFKLINPEIYFSLDQFDQDTFDMLPSWLQEQIKKTPEYEAAIQRESSKLPF